MRTRSRALTVLSLTLIVLACSFIASAPACCPAPPRGKPVVNADQTVILIWNPETKTEHFIRKASFKGEADDFGFLIPTPTQPQLEESGNEAFPFLLKLTEPETKRVPRPANVSCGCGAPEQHVTGGAKSVEVRLEKEVAGFNAAVLETKSASALTKWLRENGYAFSPEVEAWSKPYVDSGWMITALKVAKDKDGKNKKDVTAAALRLTFKTDRPLFPYREPDYHGDAQALGAKKRLLRVYFLADARYQGELTKEVEWTGRVAWANQVAPENRRRLLGYLKLLKTAAPETCWLTEFEDEWPFRPAPADLYFLRDPNQGTVQREPLIQYVSSPWPSDPMVYAIGLVLIGPALLRRVRISRTKLR
jgi:hypothetical protein